jgi:hypothetical protein
MDTDKKYQYKLCVKLFSKLWMCKHGDFPVLKLIPTVKEEAPSSSENLVIFAISAWRDVQWTMPIVVTARQMPP